MTRVRRALRLVAAAYLLALAGSHLVRQGRPGAGRPAPGERTVTTRAVRDSVELDRPVRIAVLDLPGGRGGVPAVVILHGSPGDNGQVRPLAEALHRRTGFRVLAPDLPGFGASTRSIPDYSIRAHAGYLGQLLDSLALGPVHLVGYSMGGGVALELAGARPERVRSIVLVSSIGVQEYELLGDYLLNHALHGLQLAGLWALTELVPHFGWMDDAFLGVPYARNFFDSDQRPLRRRLEEFAAPMQIVQGEADILVPPTIAAEHGRIVPQSEVRMLPGGHFMVYTEADAVAAVVADFLGRVEAGLAPRRGAATPERLARAAEPFDPAGIPTPMGFTLALVLLLLAAATLVSEDLACIAAGLLVSRGTIPFLPAAAACMIGITAGDLLLFLAGRWLGRPAIRRAPLRWLVREADVERASAWFRRRGLRLVVATRFMPGTRLPTYVAAGVLRTSFPAFAGAFLLAAAIWTPLLVGAAALLGGEVLTGLAGYRQLAGPVFLAALVALFLLVRLIPALLTWRGRRLLLSRWRRLTRWEFWPLWAVYAPVAAHAVWLGLRHRCLTLFTCANPAMPAGGLAGESKFRILEGLGLGNPAVAATVLLPASLPPDDRMARLAAFVRERGLGYPVVLKPDIGERGRGVAFPADSAQARAYLAQAADDVIAQEYAAGREFGVFYVRRPGEARGSIFSITDKRMPAVTGDGARTLEQLILADDRAVCSARFFLRAHAGELDRVPAAGEPVPLTRLGTHSRGALFLDGGALATPALTAALDRLADGYPGFCFGRYDLRVPSEEALSAGGPFTVIELNGVSSEATSIYDPATPLWRGWRVLLRQWRLAFEIGALNRARGARPTPLREVARLLGRHRRATAAHVRAAAVSPPPSGVPRDLPGEAG